MFSQWFQVQMLYFTQNLLKLYLSIVSIDKGVPHWFKYFLCGIKGVMESPKISSVEWKGAKVLVSGYIPPSAGLSSSSALVCSAAVFMSTAHNIKFGRRELADLCAHSERYIGTEGGGMDQAIAFLASRGNPPGFSEFRSWLNCELVDIFFPICRDGQTHWIQSSACSWHQTAWRSSFCHSQQFGWG